MPQNCQISTLKLTDKPTRAENSMIQMKDTKLDDSESSQRSD